MGQLTSRSKRDGRRGEGVGMRVPVADVLLLSLLVLFFGIEQRRRPELYFRFWLTGWFLILISVLCWDLPIQSAIGQTIQECLRQDASVCGGVAFVFSFLVSARRWGVPFVFALGLALPVCVGLNLIVLGAAPPWVVDGAVLIGETIAITIALKYPRRGQRWFQPTMIGVCLASGVAMVSVTARGRLDDVMNLALAEIYFVAALLFVRSKLRGGQLVGSAGFLVWGSFQVVATTSVGWQGLMPMLYSIWSVPKYLVGLGMILTIFEKAQAEIEDLGAVQKRLYEEYRVLFRSNPHPMWIYDLETMHFLAVNDAAIAEYGFSEEEFLGMSVWNLQADRDDEAHGLATQHGGQVMKRTGRHRRADGSALDVDVTDHDIVFEARQARFVLAVDITEREDLHRELVRQAQHDVLTGLPNRSVLDDRIEQCLSRCVREEKKGALLTVDIDHFKGVNDTYGHLVGDECLKVTAARLSSRVRQVDTIARTGGEEFTIVVGSLGSKAAAEKVCSELLRLFDAPVVVGEHALPVTVSIGVALFPDHAIDQEGLRRRSDQALYEAKRMGRNRAVFASTVNV